MKSFLFYFPLRTGNIVYGFTVILASLATALYLIYKACTIDKNFRTKSSSSAIVFAALFQGFEYLGILMYYITFIVVALCLFVFAVMFVYGIYKEHQCLMKAFFIYSIWHLVLTLFMIGMKAMQKDFIGLVLVTLSGLLMGLCMPGVKNLLDAYKSGNMYTRPGEVMLSPLVEDGSIVI